jgi:hypothetical protein
MTLATNGSDMEGLRLNRFPAESIAATLEPFCPSANSTVPPPLISETHTSAVRLFDVHVIVTGHVVEPTGILHLAAEAEMEPVPGGGDGGSQSS